MHKFLVIGATDDPELTTWSANYEGENNPQDIADFLYEAGGKLIPDNIIVIQNDAVVSTYTFADFNYDKYIQNCDNAENY